MKTIDIGKATETLRKYTEVAAREVLVVTKRGKPVAALVPVEDVDLESLSVSTNPNFLDIIAESRRSLARERAISPAEMRRRLGLKPLKARRKLKQSQRRGKA